MCDYCVTIPLQFWYALVQRVNRGNVFLVGVFCCFTFIEHNPVSAWKRQQRIKERQERKETFLRDKTEGAGTKILFHEKERGAKERTAAEKNPSRETNRQACRGLQISFIQQRRIRQVRQKSLNTVKIIKENKMKLKGKFNEKTLYK